MQKRKSVWCLLAFVLLGIGCLKKENGCPYSNVNIVAPAAEEQAVKKYLDSNNVTTAQKHESNMYYEVVNGGTGGTPGLCSSIKINYVGKLTNGGIFDSQSSAVFTLGVLIEGWKKGIPLIQKGGRIRLYIPPSLGYGSTDVKDKNGAVVIPANSVLIFDITLVDFQ